MRVAVAGAVVATIVSFSAIARAGDPLDKSFGATPKELLDAAKATTETGPSVILRSETAISYDDQGRMTWRHRTVVLVREREAADAWGTFETEWSPFHQAKPIVRARVVAPDGSVAELDGTLASDAPAVTEASNVFSDRRQLKAPLPRIVAGAVIEEEVTSTDTAPLFKAGATVTVGMAHAANTVREVVSFDAPTSLGLRVVGHGIPKPSKTTRGNRTTWTSDRSHVAETDLDAYEGNAPPDAVQVPNVGAATGASWAAIAVAYSQLVDAQIEKGAVTLPAAIAHGATRQTVDDSLAWLHDHVRYTGMELGDNDITPFPPAEVVKRGFGDCKDQATLLVAMLRAAGLTANVVLLDAGSGLDIDRDLPGLGQFSHAIVLVRVDGKDLWIDPTEELLPGGTLPARDVGRRVLVAASSTKDLSASPAATTALSTFRQTRTFDIADYGAGRITEVRHEAGAATNRSHHWVLTAKKADTSAWGKNYADRTYFGTLDDLVTDASGDITIRVSKSLRAWTDSPAIAVFVSPAATFSNLPDELTDKRSDMENRVRGRKQDFVWWEPHTYTIENRIPIPDGFDPPPLAAHEQISLGTMTLTTTRAIDHGAVVVTYTLDTGKTRITPAELAETRKAVLALGARDLESVRLPSTAFALRDKHEAKKAIAELQRQIALRPKAAMPHVRLAYLYQGYGMTAAAGREAKRAVELEPKSAAAYTALGGVIEGDVLGRRFGLEIDRPGAIAAYRKAIELDPTVKNTHLLLHDALVQAGVGRSAPVAKDWLEAATELRRADEIDDSHAHDLKIAKYLNYAGKGGDAEAAARKLPESDDQRAIVVTAVTVQRGSQAGLAALADFPADRAEAIAGKVLSEMLLMRRYDDARAFAVLTKKRSAGVTAMWDHIAKIDVAKLDPKDPKTPVLLLVSSILHGPTHRAWSADVETDKDGLRSEVMKELGGRDLFVENVLEIVATQLTAEGDDHDGYRVSLAFTKSATFVFLVASDGKQLAVVGGSHLAKGTAAYLRSLASDAKRAGRVLDWLDADVSSWAPFRALVRNERNGSPPSKELVEVAAGLFDVLAKDYGHGADAVAALAKCEPMNADLRYVCRIGKALTELGTARYADAADTAAKILETKPEDPFGWPLRVGALGEQHQGSAERTQLDAIVAKHPGELAYLRAEAIGALYDSWAAAAPWLDKLADHDQMQDSDLRLIVQQHLVHDPDATAARAIGDRIEARLKTVPDEMQMPLAAIAAESDDPLTARNHLDKSVRRFEEPSPHEWYVIGRIAEACGLKDDAIAAYRRTKKPTGHRSVADADWYDLAVRGLKRLGVNP